VVIPTYGDSTMSITATNSVLSDANAAGLDVEVIIVDNGSGIEVGQELIQQFGVGGRVRYHRLPRNLNFAIGCDVGLALATGELTLFLNNDTEVRSGALARLVGAMEDPDVMGAQPLLVYADETIQTAGTMFSVRDGLPNHLLVNHPPADAVPLGGAPLDAVSAAALLVRTDQARDVGGFDPIYVNGMEDVDLCLRMKDRLGGYFVVVPEAMVVHLESKTPGRGSNVVENRRLFLERWQGRLPAPRHDLLERAGFRLIAVGSDGRDVPGPRPYVARVAEDRLRWGIKVSSVPGPRGDMWGDTHFAASLATALERSGHRAVVYRRGAHLSYATAFDDVNLVIRGRDRARPMPGQINVLWVISHPEDVTVQEIREFDLIFAASVRWSREMTVRSGRTVEPLLQATDADRFHPAVDLVPHDVPLFVGGTHPGRERRVVADALAAEIPIGVYGPGWDGMLPSSVYRGVYIPNEDLAGYYRSAPRVLADHWDNMAREGFVQNRIFDAVASGARVVSDPVEDLDELFRGAVQVYSGTADLKFLCDPQSDSMFPDDRELLEIAEWVRTQHSFENRAERLAAAVSDLHENAVSSGVTSYTRGHL
jgi:GT2 family glycosyltransferase